MQNEIIEIGAIKIDINGNYVSEFNEFVKPILNPTLSEFCKSLTTISQVNIDSSDTYNVVVENFKRWIINLDMPFV